MQGCKMPLKEMPFEDLLPKKHLLRLINEALDLSFIYRLTKPYYFLNNGRNSIDPILYFRIQLIAYFFNISSERRVCHDLKFNLA
jgi:transposase